MSMELDQPSGLTTKRPGRCLNAEELMDAISRAMDEGRKLYIQWAIGPTPWDSEFVEVDHQVLLSIVERQQKKYEEGYSLYTPMFWFTAHLDGCLVSRP